jgi:hypothetical protein
MVFLVFPVLYSSCYIAMRRGQRVEMKAEINGSVETGAALSGTLLDLSLEAHLILVLDSPI